MDISQAHIDSTIYLGDATLEFAERLASLGAKVAVPTSLNVSGVDECGWKDWAVAPEWAAKAARQMLAYERMGAVPTWTCAPYQTHMRPVFGQQIAWGESNAIAFANSVIGARTERYPDLLDICCAITGRVPADRAAPDRTSRRADAAAARPACRRRCSGTISSSPSSATSSASSPATAFRSSTASSSRRPEDHLKAFAAAAASSGRVALFHMVGVTPEAPTLDAAFHGRRAGATLAITHGGPARRARRADHRRRPRARHGDSRQPALLAGRVLRCWRRSSRAAARTRGSSFSSPRAG